MSQFVYNLYSDTIRKMPENYLVATRVNKRWTVDPDKALDVELACICFRIVFEQFDLTWGSGDVLAAVFNDRLGM
jgi:hypothetical protein